ncbi:tegument protein VP11/12 [Macropodid alphaherpesvirus 2]|uniref:Tegument protein VP11/12 n=1 Tax=Macropodid alphaherpesvirus 2 TaxID=83440 RepID=A0AAE7MLJ1_9ALPH|nr:tegument protein VP11/12 [Macropodid alphaherpesvirus 2]QOD40202.1 tegument protein VP11/12 [Macropodid alphaherpesvirus 2]WGO49719.1 tegument protein VP11/12 [Macropodid alphaherpesvirus 2]
MHRHQRKSTSSTMPGCVTSRELGRTRNPSFLPQRIYGSCILPTPDGLISSAVRALKYHSDELQPPFLTTADRTMRLEQSTNSVPEDLIIDGITNDAQRTYFRHYLAAAKRSLEDHPLANDEIWRGIQMQYWKYFQRVVEGDITIPAPQARDRDPSVYVLLRSTIHRKLLSRSPFKPPEQSAKYTQTLRDLDGALHKVQQYLYYMRPDQPDAPSDTTALRLAEILSYVSVLYKWADWMMWITDKYVCECLDPSHQRLRIPLKSFPQPGTLFSQYLTQSPGATANSMECHGLRTLLSDVLGYLTHISHLWELGKRHKNGVGTPDTIVATVEILSLLHHHAQYIINTVQTGYIVWATDGLKNNQLWEAVTHQDRFCRVTAPIFPLMTVSSWAEMELGLKAWFTANLATSFFPNLTPTPHYATFLRDLTGERGGICVQEPPTTSHGNVQHAAVYQAGRNLIRRTSDDLRTGPGSTNRTRVPSTRTPQSPLQDPFDEDPPDSPRLFSLPITLGGEAVAPLNTLREIVTIPTYARMNSVPRSPLHPNPPQHEPQAESVYRPHRAMSPRQPTCDGEYLLIRPGVRPPPIGASAPVEEESVYEVADDDDEEEAIYEPIGGDDPIYNEISGDEPIYEEIPAHPHVRRHIQMGMSRLAANGAVQLVNPLYNSTDTFLGSSNTHTNSTSQSSSVAPARPPRGASLLPAPLRLSAPAASSSDRPRRSRLFKSNPHHRV